MSHSGLLDAAVKAVQQHLAVRGAQISAEVVRQLKTEGIYPYDDQPATGALAMERQTFVVTAARHARGAQRRRRVVWVV
jgi:hypothetical protein